MTNFTSGIIFIVAVLTCLTADSAPLWLTVSWVAVAAVIALAGRAEGRKRPSGATNTRRPMQNRKSP